MQRARPGETIEGGRLSCSILFSDSSAADWNAVRYERALIVSATARFAGPSYAFPRGGRFALGPWMFGLSFEDRVRAGGRKRPIAARDLGLELTGRPT